jgi:alpha-N-acetylglucosaminidase
LTPKDLSLHFAGPAFLAWQRMGNMYGWGGPLPPSWHEFQVKLQHRILKRMRKLGMTPVLPAFAGHIPKALLALYPNITYTSTKWNHFGPTYLLDSTDPLFNPIGSSFIKEYIEEFGDTDHVYNCDAFNEMTPASNDPGFIRKSGKAIYDAIASVDENAVWIMQGWLFRSSFWKRDQAKALLTSVEPGEMIVLDLASTEFTEYDRLDSFFGQPFIFNDLNNYGGNTGFFGRIGRINERLFQARNMYVYFVLFSVCLVSVLIYDIIFWRKIIAL